MGRLQREPNRSSARWWPEAVVVAVVSLALALVVLQVWRQPFSYPFNYDGDGPYYLMLAEGLKRHGSFLVNPDLGFPFGQVLYDAPENLDFLHLVVLRFLTAFSSAPVATNLFQLLTFPTIGGVAHVVLRRLGIHRLLAGSLAVLYVFLPYHLQRRSSHLFLSSYAMVPVLVLLALTLLTDRPPSVDPRHRRNWWTIAACVGLAMTGPYYAAFVVLLWGISAGFAALARRSVVPLVRAATMIAVLGGVALLELVPNLRYWRDHGRNDAVVTRSPHETEIYGIRLQQLLMPRWDHRNGVLAKIGLRSLRGPFLAEGTQSLGIIGAVGFLGLLGFVLLRAVRSGPSADRSVDRSADPSEVPAASTSPIVGDDPGPTTTTLSRLAFLVIVSLLLGIVSGFGFFVSWAGLRPIRSYNRIMLVIAFCALAAIGIVVSRWLDRRAPRRPWLPAAVAAGLLLVGLWDQTSPNDATYRSSGRQTWEIDRGFYGEMARRLPAGCGGVRVAVRLVPGEHRRRHHRHVRPGARLPPRARPSLELRRHDRANRGAARRPHRSRRHRRSSAYARGLGFRAVSRRSARVRRPGDRRSRLGCRRPGWCPRA